MHAVPSQQPLRRPLLDNQQRSSCLEQQQFTYCWLKRYNLSAQLASEMIHAHRRHCTECFWVPHQAGSGVVGPVLLEDYHLIEKLAQFDRERIPERVVHARGATAKGFFEVSSAVCAALVLL